LSARSGLPSGANQLESAYRVAVRFEMPVRILHSKQNARLKELRRALRSPERNAGVIGIEGPNLVEEALRAGLRFRAMFFTQGFLYAPSQAGQIENCEMLVVPREILSSVLQTETPQPAAALVEPPEWTWAHLFPQPKLFPQAENPPLVLVLAGLQDPGNLGTILRSAEALGASGAISLPGTVSPWNQKAMRASAGSVFRLPLVHAGVEECFRRLREAGITTWTTAVRGATRVDSVDFSRPTALMIGNEGNGVPEEMAAHADGVVTIPCPGPVESLNAAVATGILLYEAARQRLAAVPGRSGT
jgi:RNA methyltransferase, TrmH family